MKTYHTNIPAAYIIFKRGSEVLLLRRANTGYEDGNYSLVAGHVEAGEPFSAAAVREAYEEAGVIVRAEDLEMCHMIHRRASDGDRGDVFFLVTVWKGELVNKEPQKCDDLSWFSLSMLPHNLIPFVRQALEMTQAGQVYSEWGWKKE